MWPVWANKGLSTATWLAGNRKLQFVWGEDLGWSPALGLLGNEHEGIHNLCFAVLALGISHRLGCSVDLVRQPNIQGRLNTKPHHPQDSPSL